MLKGGNSIFLLAQSALSKLPSKDLQNKLQELFSKVNLSTVIVVVMYCVLV